MTLICVTCVHEYIICINMTHISQVIYTAKRNHSLDFQQLGNVSVNSCEYSRVEEPGQAN